MFPIQLAEEARGPERTQHMSTTLACPHCKLSLTIQDGAGGSVLVYDQDERTRRCKFPQHPSPAWCLGERTADHR
jgi:hypothetical protein